MSIATFIRRRWTSRRKAAEPGPVADWPYRLADCIAREQGASIQARLDVLEKAAQYGWGHTIDFGPFKKEGILGSQYLAIAGLLDQWGWWPHSFDGWRVADVGCFTGGLTLLMAARQPEVVYAVDEIPQHLAQCRFLCEVFGVQNVRHVEASLYRLCDHIEEGSLDLVLLSGVIYHLSDMLVGLLALRNLLRVGGSLIIESNAVRDDKHSYANFGRFSAGMWWQPSSLCIKDMCGLMGLGKPEIRFHQKHRCLVRALRTDNEDIPFKRGLNWPFDSLRDGRPRPSNPDVMAPARG